MNDLRSSFYHFSAPLHALYQHEGRPSSIGYIFYPATLVVGVVSAVIDAVMGIATTILDASVGCSDEEVSNIFFQRVFYYPMQDLTFAYYGLLAFIGTRDWKAAYEETAEFLAVQNKQMEWGHSILRFAPMEDRPKSEAECAALLKAFLEVKKNLAPEQPAQGGGSLHNDYWAERTRILTASTPEEVLPREIRKTLDQSYRTLSQKVHPDSNASVQDDAKNLFNIVKAAYDCQKAKSPNA